MARHSIPEAAKMVGLNRKTMYKHIKQGKVSSHIGHDGSKYIDTSELIRAYGKVETLGDSSGDTSGDTTETANLLRELIAVTREQAATIKEQTGRLERIEQELKKRPRLEHKPAKKITYKPKEQQETQPKPTPAPTQDQPAKHAYSDLMANLRASLRSEEKK